MTLDDNKLYIKIIALHTTYNYIVYKFFIWNYLESQNIVSQRFWNFILKLFKKTLDVDMVYIKVCGYNLELCSWKVFELKLFRGPNICFKFIDIEFQNL